MNFLHLGYLITKVPLNAVVWKPQYVSPPLQGTVEAPLQCQFVASRKYPQIPETSRLAQLGPCPCPRA